MDFFKVRSLNVSPDLSCQSRSGCRETDSENISWDIEVRVPRHQKYLKIFVVIDYLIPDVDDLPRSLIYYTLPEDRHQNRGHLIHILDYQHFAEPETNREKLLSVIIRLNDRNKSNLTASSKMVWNLQLFCETISRLESAKCFFNHSTPIPFGSIKSGDKFVSSIMTAFSIDK